MTDMVKKSQKIFEKPNIFKNIIQRFTESKIPKYHYKTQRVKKNFKSDRSIIKYLFSL